MSPDVTLDELYAPFADHSDRPVAVTLPGEVMPEPYQTLLDHCHHMTVTVEEFYGDSVNVVVLDEVRTEIYYARKIILALAESGRPVQFGVVRVELGALAEAVREEILSGRTPLGRVLIRHRVLREVRPVGFFRCHLTGAMAGWLGATPGAETYGRLGVITAGGAVAVRVAEVLAPVAAAE